MRLVFLGTPEIARTCLAGILKTNHKVVAVVTKPDKEVGRGNKITFSPVKELALKNNIPVYQFKSLSKEGVEILKSLKPDVLVLVAFGQILSQEILNIALPINLHGSLLPKYRGPSPIQSAILNGETESGVTVMKMESEVDSGDVLIQDKIKIQVDDNSENLFKKMAETGAKAIIKSLDLIEQGKAEFKKQNSNLATFTTMLTKENAKIDFNDNVGNIVNKIRAYNPNPVAYFEIEAKKYKIYKARRYMGKVEKNDYQNGEVVLANGKQGLIVKSKDGYVEILEIQAPNGKILTAKQFLNGKTISTGTIIK